MATKAEIIERLSQCGGLSYQGWVELLDSIYFDKDMPIPEKAPGFDLGAPADDKIYFGGSGTYTLNGVQGSYPDPLNVFFWNKSEWDVLEIPIEVPEPDFSGLATKEELSKKISYNKLISDDRFIGMIDAFSGTVNTFNLQARPLQISKESGRVTIAVGTRAYTFDYPGEKEGVKYFKLYNGTEYIWVVVNWDIVTGSGYVPDQEEEFTINSPKTFPLKNFYEMLASSEYIVKNITAYHDGEIPKEMDIIWADGVNGTAVLSSFDENVLEFKRKTTTHGDWIITHGEITYDELGYIKSQNPIILNKI